MIHKKQIIIQNNYMFQAVETAINNFGKIAQSCDLTKDFQKFIVWVFSRCGCIETNSRRKLMQLFSILSPLTGMLYLHLYTIIPAVLDSFEIMFSYIIYIHILQALAL